MSDHAVKAAPATIELTIDGKLVTVPRGTTILNAARQNGVYIPTLCYVEKLNPIGSCRLCSVEVEGSKGPIMSCVTPVTSGMKVTTQSEALAAHRQKMMRFILTNHPLDCPVCERSGECSLQNRTFELDVVGHDYRTDGHKKTPVANWKALRYDRNLCIFCERCVKICREVQGIAALSIDGWGYKARIKPNAGETLDCDFCGQCLSVCPVGAISSSIIFNGRSWEMDKTQTVCPYCAVGCSFHANTRKGSLVRITSDDTIGVNNGNLCARGRFGFEAHQGENRVKTPLVRKGGRLEPATWEEAIALAASKLKQIHAASGPGSIAVIGGEGLYNEDAYVLQKVFRAGLGVWRIDNPANMRNPELNSGICDTFGGAAPIVEYSEIRKADSFFFFGADAEKENPVIANMVRMKVRDHGAPMFAANTRNIGFAPAFDRKVIFAPGSEAALVAGIIRAMLDTNIKDNRAAKAAGANPLLGKSAQSVSVEDAAKVSGVSAGEIRALAAAFLKNGAPLVVMGSGVYTHPKGAQIAKGLINLATLLGGKAMLYRESANSQGVNGMGISPSHLPGYMKAGDEKAAAHYSQKWGKKISPASGDGLGIFDGLAQKKIKAVVIAGADPVTHSEGGGSIAQALAGAEFTVVTTQFLTETALLANVVFPSSTSMERDGACVNNEGRTQSIKKVIEPAGQSRPDWEIFAALGSALGLNLAYTAAADVAAEIAADVPANAALSGDGGAFEFDTAAQLPARGGDYPMMLVTGSSLFHHGTMSRQCPALNSLDSAAELEICAADAEKLGFKDGDGVLVESKEGSIKLKAAVTAKSPSGVVFVAKNFENAPALHLFAGGQAAVAVKISKLA
ncbi:MAG: molybdopterin-dependent oxidoreductase [Nitrospinae bacterium]|nr:molybdopterin-dependent oxidoreductase [Nitrospinota bacterium]